jgi:hypothetical protein
MTNGGRNMYCGVEQIFKFKTFKGFKKQVACETADNEQLLIG